jgi:hypothetical protein
MEAGSRIVEKAAGGFAGEMTNDEIRMTKEGPMMK